MEITIVYSALLKEFVTIWHEAVKLNSAQSQFELAMLYAVGKNESSASKAVDWFRKAAKQGHTEAQFALGGCYENGYGVKRSDRQAIGWYKNAYHQVSIDLMDNPDPVADDTAAAISEYLQNTDWEDIFGEELDSEEDSFEIDEEAAECGDAEAQQRLGHRYYYGQGVEKNYNSIQIASFTDGRMNMLILRTRNGYIMKQSILKNQILTTNCLKISLLQKYPAWSFIQPCPV